MNARRPAPLVPLTIEVGVDDQFGWLVDPSGTDRRRLCEVVRISRTEAVLTCLDDGAKLIAPADGSRQWQQLRPEVACALVGMAPPPRHNQWRLDPFWVERHRSAEWRAIVEIVAERALPVHYAAVMFARGQWDPALWDGPCTDSASIFASGVLETMARGLDLRSAVAARLDADHELDVTTDPMRRARLLLDSGWYEALPDLPKRIAAHRTILAPGGHRPEPGTPAPAASHAAVAQALQLPGLLT